MASKKKSWMVREFVPNFAVLRLIRTESDASIANLVKVAGLIPELDLRYSDLSDVDWRGSAIGKLDLTGAVVSTPAEGGPVNQAPSGVALTQRAIDEDIEFYQRAILLFAHTENPFWRKVSRIILSQGELLNYLGFSASVIWHWRRAQKISVACVDRLQAGAIKFASRAAAIDNIDETISQTIEQYFTIIRHREQSIGYLSDFLEYSPIIAEKAMRTIKRNYR